VHGAAEFLEQLHELLVLTHEGGAIRFAPLGVDDKIADNSRRAYQNMLEFRDHIGGAPHA